MKQQKKKNYQINNKNTQVVDVCWYSPSSLALSFTSDLPKMVLIQKKCKPNWCLS